MEDPPIERTDPAYWRGAAPPIPGSLTEAEQAAYDVAQAEPRPLGPNGRPMIRDRIGWVEAPEPAPPGNALGDFIVPGAITERRAWAVEGVWNERAQGIIGGQDKDAKSTHTFELALSLATATPMWGLIPVHSDPARVLIVQAEIDDAEIARRWMLTLQARDITEAPNLTVLSRADALKISLLGEGASSGLTLKGVADSYDYIFIDPLMAFGYDVDEYGADDGQAHNWFNKMAAEHDCAVIYTTLTKDSSLGMRSVFGRRVRGWVENALVVRRKDVAQHPDWSDMDVRRYATRFDYAPHEFNLRGKGTGVFELREKEAGAPAEERPASKTKKQRMKVYADDVIAFPEASMRERSERLDIPVPTLERYKKEIATKS
jgi:RecA-family ATPase